MTKRTLISVSLILVAGLILTFSMPGQPSAASPNKPVAVPKPEAFNWKMRAGEKLRVAMATQTWSEFINKYIPEFKNLTGIDITYEILPEDQFPAEDYR